MLRQLEEVLEPVLPKLMLTSHCNKVKRTVSHRTNYKIRAKKKKRVLYRDCTAIHGALQLLSSFICEKKVLACLCASEAEIDIY